MSDYIQALELQITGNAEKAGDSLDKLAASLRKIKSAIAGGINLRGVSTELGDFVGKVRAVGSRDNISAINNLTNAIRGLVTEARGLKEAKAALATVQKTVAATTGAPKTSGIASTPMSVVSSGAAQAVEEVRAVANELERVKLTAADIKIDTITPKERSAPDPAVIAERRRELVERTASAESRLVDIQAREAGTLHELRQELDAYEASTARATGAEFQRASAMEEVVETAREQMAGPAAAMSETATATEEVVEATRELAPELKNVKDAHEEAAKGADENRKAHDGFRSALLRAHSVLGQLGRRLKSLIMYRGLRAMLKEVSDGFKTGLENVRKYGEAVNSLYYRDMSGLDNTLLKMKNSLGASLAAALRSVIPLFQQLASWVITVSNYVNQFFALLNGQSTWTRAVDVQTDALEDQQKAATGAAKATKNLLASWDELNIIQSAGGGGGAGGAAEDLSQYERMFEEVGTFDQRIRDAINWVKDNMNEVYGIAAGIAALLLGAKFSVALVIAGVTTSYLNGKESGLNGETFLTAVKNNIIGIAETALGSALLGFKLAGLKGAIVGLFIGVGIGIAATYIGWQEGTKQRLLDAAWGDIHLTDEQIKQYIKEMFGYDIYAEINVISTRVNGIKQARDALIEAIDGLSGKYSAMVVLGIENATTEDIQSLAADVQDVVQKVQALFDKHKVNIGVMLNKGIITEEDAQSALSGMEGLNRYINGLGTDIGRILSDGVVDEFEKETLDGLMNALTRVTSAVTTGQRTGQAIGRVGNMLGGYELSNLDRDSFNRLTTEYNSLRSEFRQLADDSAAEYQGMLYGVWQGMLEANADGTEHFTPEEVAEAEARARGFNSREYADQMYEIYFGAADDEFRRRLQESLPANVRRGIVAHGGLENFGRYYAERARVNDPLNGINGLGSEVAYSDTFKMTLDALIEDLIGFNPGSAGVNSWGLLGDEAKSAIQQYYAGLGLEDEFLSALRGAYGVGTETSEVTQAVEEVADVVEEVSDAVEEVSEIGENAVGEIANGMAVAVENTVSGYRLEFPWSENYYPGSAPAGFEPTLASGVVGYSSFDYFVFRGSDGSLIFWDDINEVPVEVAQEVYDHVNDWFTQNGIGSPSGTGGGGAPSVSESDNDDDVRDNERNAMLRQLITLAQEIANKDWTVTPSAGWGAFNAKSGQLYASVKG